MERKKNEAIGKRAILLMGEMVLKKKISKVVLHNK